MQNNFGSCPYVCGGNNFKYHLMHHTSPLELLRMWQWLPDVYKRDIDVKVCLPCFEHYNLPTNRTHIDGPPPPRKYCINCLQQLNNSICTP